MLERKFVLDICWRCRWCDVGDDGCTVPGAEIGAGGVSCTKFLELTQEEQAYRNVKDERRCDYRSKQ